MIYYRQHSDIQEGQFWTLLISKKAGTGMLNAASLNAVKGSKFSRSFIKPLYDSYCFANIPQTVTFLLTGEGQSTLPVDVFGNLPTRYDKVVLFFVDAFGWRFFSKYAERYELLKAFLNHGVVSKMTSQFPSTTAAHVTSIHTGLSVAQSGIYEWNYYEPLVDDVISPLLFSYAGERTPGGDLARDSLKRSSVPVEAFFPRQSFYQQLKSKGVESSIHQFYAYTPSTYSDIVFQGASVFPYQRLRDTLEVLTDRLLSGKDAPIYNGGNQSGDNGGRDNGGGQPRHYIFLYYDKIDAVGHVYGPESQQFEDAVDLFFNMMQQCFFEKLYGKLGNTLFIMTADHGQVDVNPKTTFYLNTHAPGVERYLQINQKGRFLVPAGSARDMFLHVKEELMDEAIAFLQEHLAGLAEVYRTKDLMEQHIFGKEEPSQEFLGRVGNVVILPYENGTVWWFEKGKFEMHFLGHHGGLTPEEMEIPLLILPL